MSTENLFSTERSSQNEELFKSIQKFSGNEEKSSKVVAIVYANFYSLLQAAYLLGCKLCLLQGIQYLDLIFFRFFVGMLIDIVSMKANKKTAFNDLTCKKTVFLLAVRAILAVMSSLSAVGSLALIPTLFTALIEKTSVCIVALLSFLLLKETLSKYYVLSILTGYFGVSLIILGNNKQNSQEEISKRDFILGIFLIQIAALSLAGILMITRYLKHIHYSVIVFHSDCFGVLVLACSLISISIHQEKSLSLLSYSWADYCQIILVCSFNSFSLFCQTLAVQKEKAGVVGVIFYTQVLFNFLGDVILFKDVFSLVQIGGALLILFTNVSMTLMQARNYKS